MTKLNLSTSLSNASPATVAAYTSEPYYGGFLPSQIWTWKGGDAIMVIDGRGNGAAFVRFGKTIRSVICRGINDALQQLGRDPARFTIA